MLRCESTRKNKHLLLHRMSLEISVGVEGRPASTCYRMDRHLGTRGSVDQILVPVQVRACSVSEVCVTHIDMSGAPQQGHLTARSSSIPRKRRPMRTNSVAGMTRDESTGFILKRSTAESSHGRGAAEFSELPTGGAQHHQRQRHHHPTHDFQDIRSPNPTSNSLR